MASEMRVVLRAPSSRERPVRGTYVGLASAAGLALLATSCQGSLPAFTGGVGQLPPVGRVQGNVGERGVPPSVAVDASQIRTPTPLSEVHEAGSLSSVAWLAAGAVAGLALSLSNRSLSAVTMNGKHDRRTFHGKLKGHTFGKYRFRKTKARRLKAIRNGTFKAEEVVQRGQPEPDHCWDDWVMVDNLWYTGNMPQWYKDMWLEWFNGMKTIRREEWKTRMGKYGKQIWYKNWTPPGQEAPPELVAAAVVSTKISAADVKELRERSRAGILDCKKALAETDGDMDKAMDWLRKKGIAKADKKAGNVAVEGNIASYVHFNKKLAVLVEVNSETDFVASNAIFKEFANDIAMQIAANPTVTCVTSDDVPEEVKQKEKELEMQKEDLADKPDNIKEKMVTGRLKKKFDEMALVNQKWLKDEDKTVDEVIKERIAKLGENIVVRRFVRLNLGEGLEKKDTDFAAGVEKELAKYRTGSEGAAKEEKPAEEEKPKEEKPVEEKPKEEAKPAVAVSAAQVKELRQRSGAGIMDSKKALAASDGDMDKAMEWLKKKGMAKADKKAGNVSAEGAIASYVHFNSKLGVIVEVNSETDFVAMNAIFKEFSEDVAMQIAANPAIVSISADDVPPDVIAKEKEIEMNREDLEGKPDNIKEKIVTGRLKKKYEEVSLMSQKWLKDEEKTVEDVLKERIAKLGENIVIRRFERLVLGEGLEKKEDDFAAGVEKELAKYRS